MRQKGRQIGALADAPAHHPLPIWAARGTTNELALQAPLPAIKVGIANRREGIMVERKAALHRAPKRPELMASLENAPRVTDAQLQKQRASFAYGNAPKNSRITKASAESAAKRLLLDK